MQNDVQCQEEHILHRDVSSTARLFNFNQPVYMTEQVWKDCVELVSMSSDRIDELAVLQRLRHVLFMASSAMYDKEVDVSCEFSIHCVPNDKMACAAEQITLKLESGVNKHDQSQVTIKHLDE